VGPEIPPSVKYINQFRRVLRHAEPGSYVRNL
jgi:hypothetical protein